MNKILNLLDVFLLKILVVVLSLMTLSVIIAVFLRYFFGISYVWFQELIVYLFIFTTFFGSVIAYSREEHLAINVLYNKFSEKVQIKLKLFFDLLILYLNLQLIRVSIKWINQVGNVVTPGMRIPMKYIYIILPLSSVLMLLYSIGNIYLKFKKIKIKG